jgi:acyl-CoA thioester hydrolase
VSSAAPGPEVRDGEPRPCPLPPGLAGDGRAAVPHPRPFACEIVATAAGSSRAVDHVSNVTFVRWLDRVAELHCDAAGFARPRMLADGRMWFVARHEIDYLAEVVPGDRLVALTWVRDLRRVKSWRDTVFVRMPGESVVCRAATLWVYVNLTTRRPTTVPPEMAAALDPLLSPLVP